jgi:hypothetical protein
MESVYHIVAIHVNEISWAHVWRLRFCYLGTGYDIRLHHHGGHLLHDSLLSPLSLGAGD